MGTDPLETGLTGSAGLAGSADFSVVAGVVAGGEAGVAAGATGFVEPGIGGVGAGVFSQPATKRPASRGRMRVLCFMWFISM
jgi:hypothetical protein